MPRAVTRLGKRRVDCRRVLGTERLAGDEHLDLGALVRLGAVRQGDVVMGLKVDREALAQLRAW